MDDIELMQLALEQAERAARVGEVPVGAVLASSDGMIIACSYNQRESAHDPTAHAEMLVIREASKALGRWRLTGTVLAVTLEPCLMCAGAAVLARIDRLIYGAPDPKAGAVASLFTTLNDSRLNHQVAVQGGVLAEASRALLQNFFRVRRG